MTSNGYIQYLHGKCFEKSTNGAKQIINLLY